MKKNAGAVTLAVIMLTMTDCSSVADSIVLKTSNPRGGDEYAGSVVMADDHTIIFDRDCDAKKRREYRWITEVRAVGLNTSCKFSPDIVAGPIADFSCKTPFYIMDSVHEAEWPVAKFSYKDGKNSIGSGSLDLKHGTLTDENGKTTKFQSKNLRVTIAYGWCEKNFEKGKKKLIQPYTDTPK